MAELWEWIKELAVSDTMSFATILMAIFTFLLAIFSLWQTLSIRSSVKKELRAYVGFLSGEIIFKKQHDGMCHVSGHISMKNYGKSPAHNTSYWIEKPVIVNNNKNDKFTNISRRKRNFVAQNVILFPTMSDDIVSPNICIEMNEFINGESQYMVIIEGGVRYKDIFRRSRHYKFLLRNGPITRHDHSEIVFAVTSHLSGHEAN